MIFDINSQRLNNILECSEKYVQTILENNFQILFPDLKLISREFVLKGDVRQFGISGRIDILSWNPETFEIVIIEIKKNHSKNIIIQAIDYADFIEENYELILNRIMDMEVSIKKRMLKEKKKPKIILIAKNFLHPSIKRLDKLPNKVRIIEYLMFENGLLSFKELTENNAKKESVVLENTSASSLLNTDKDVMQTIIEIIKFGLIDNERNYKIENGSLFINQSECYKVYKEYLLDRNESVLSKFDFFKSLKNSDHFIKFHSSVRFLKRKTSAMELEFHL